MAGFFFGVPTMKAILTIMLALDFVSPATNHLNADEPSPVPALSAPFQLPLSDGSTVSAQFIRLESKSTWLVYVSKNGRFSSHRLETDEINPIPINPPDPIIVPQKLSVTILVDKQTMTLEQMTVLSDPSWRKIVSESHAFLGIVDPKDYQGEGEKPPERLQPFLKAAEGKQLPRLMFSDEKGTVIFGADLPTTSAEIITILKKYGA
jgi:hypothetical protein